MLHYLEICLPKFVQIFTLRKKAFSFEGEVIMDEEKKKEGMSVKEIEGYAKKNRFELFFCLLIVVASLFTFVFWGPVLSVFCLGAGGVVSTLMHSKVEPFAKKMAGTLLNKQGTTQMILGIVALIVAIFVAPVVFFLIGVHAGKSMVHLARDSSSAGGTSS